MQRIVVELQQLDAIEVLLEGDVARLAGAGAVVHWVVVVAVAAWIGAKVEQLQLMMGGGLVRLRGRSLGARQQGCESKSFGLARAVNIAVLVSTGILKPVGFYIGIIIISCIFYLFL